MPYPTDGIDEHRGDCSVGCRFIACDGRLEGHVHSHVDVRSQLTAQSSEEAASSTNDVDQTPSEYHGEDQLDNAIGSRRDERAVLAFDARVVELFHANTSKPMLGQAG